MSDTNSTALIIVTDTKSKVYVNFKQNLQKESTQVVIRDIDAVNNGKPKNGKYIEKLSNSMKYCDAIVVICSETLKNYLDNGKDSKCNLLKKAEREVLMKGFEEYSYKIIPITIDENGKNFTPSCLKGYAVVDAEVDMTTLDDIIKSKKLL